MNREAFNSFAQHPVMARASKRVLEMMDQRYGPRGAPTTVDELLELTAEAFAADPAGLAFLREHRRDDGPEPL